MAADNRVPASSIRAVRSDENLSASSIRRFAGASDWATASVVSLEVGPTPAQSIYQSPYEAYDGYNDAQSVRTIFRAEEHGSDAMSIRMEYLPPYQDEQKSKPDPNPYFAALGIQQMNSTAKVIFPTFPLMTVRQLRTWTLRTDYTSYDTIQNLPLTEDPREPEIIRRLTSRNYIFMLDRANSMHPHRQQVSMLETDLTRMITRKRLGLCRSQTFDAEIDLNEWSESGITLPPLDLENLLMSQNWPTANETPPHKFSSNKTPAYDPGLRPVTVLFLTDGLWDIASFDELRFFKRFASSARKLLNHVQRTQTNQDQLRIHFICFDRDGNGPLYLKYRCDYALPELESLPRNLFDVTNADGNVWRMLLGTGLEDLL